LSPVPRSDGNGVRARVTFGLICPAGGWATSGRRAADKIGGATERQKGTDDKIVGAT
jgi:hypothetical protein